MKYKPLQHIKFIINAAFIYLLFLVFYILNLIIGKKGIEKLLTIFIKFFITHTKLGNNLKTNLQMLFTELTEDIVNKHISDYSQNIARYILTVTYINYPSFDDIKFINWEKVENIKDRPIILSVAHLGNIELNFMALLIKAPYSNFFYRKFKNIYVNSLIIWSRKRFVKHLSILKGKKEQKDENNQKINRAKTEKSYKSLINFLLHHSTERHDKDAPIKVIKTMIKKGTLLIFLDEKIKTNGIKVKFLGTDFSVSPLPSKMVSKYNAAIIPIKTYYEGDVFHYEVQDEIDCENKTNEEISQSLINEYESWIMDSPAQYLPLVLKIK